MLSLSWFTFWIRLSSARLVLGFIYDSPSSLLNALKFFHSPTPCSPCRVLHPLCPSAVDVLSLDLFVCLYSNFFILYILIASLISNTLNASKIIECNVQYKHPPPFTSPSIYPLVPYIHPPSRRLDVSHPPPISHLAFGLWIRRIPHAPVTLVYCLHSLPLTIMNTHSFVPIPPPF